MIEAALTETRGKVAGTAGAAAKLGIPASTLESKIKQLGSRNADSTHHSDYCSCPQLVDPRSGANGLFLIGSPGFRAVKARQHRQFIGTPTTVGSIDGVKRFHEPRTSRPFDVSSRRQ